MRLFVYGTLCDPLRQERVIGRRAPSRPARLRGYERRETAYPYVVEAPDGVVDGLVLEDIDDAAMARLDAYEDEGRLYERRTVVVEVGGQLAPCDVYVGLAIADR